MWIWIGAVLIVFLGIGLLTSWVLAVGFLFLVALIFLVLNWIDKIKLKKIREGYNEEKNESKKPDKAFNTGIGFRNTVDTREFRVEDSSINKEPRTDEQIPDKHARGNDNKTEQSRRGVEEDKGRHKSNRIKFKPI